MSTISSFVHGRMRKALLSKGILALDLVLWLFWMPLILRIHTIPTLLKRLAPGEKHKDKTPIELKDAVGIVTRICNLRVFRPPFFSKLCLRQSLALYRTLTQMGYPVEIHFGVRKDDKTLSGHSWVTLKGEVVADTAQTGIFKAVYTYPPAHPASALSKSESKILMKRQEKGGENEKGKRTRATRRTDSGIFLP
jgi:hypothetical protein